MSTHPEISNLAREERIRAIAYSLWEDDGRPEGCAEQHWYRACELVAAEAEPIVDTAVEPDGQSSDGAAVVNLPEPVASEQTRKRSEAKRAA